MVFVVIPWAPVRSLRPVMMTGVLLFGVSWIVNLSHPARQRNVSVNFALLTANDHDCQGHALVEKELVHFFERHFICCLLAYVVFHGQVRICGIVQRQSRELLPPFLRSTGTSAALRSLPLFVVHPDVLQPKAPKTRCINQVWCSLFQWSFCPTNHGTTIFPKDTSHYVSLSCGSLGNDGSLRSLPRDWCVSRSVRDGEK